MAMLLSWSVTLCLDTARADQIEDDWLERSRAVLDSVDGVVAPEWLRMEAGPREQQIAAELGGQAVKTLPGAEGSSVSVGRLLIFGSLSLPRETLRALLDEAKQPDAVFVLRGVPAGASIGAVLRKLRDVIGPEHAANVVIDPSLYSKYGISQVPTFVLERGPGKGAILVEGAVTADWVRRAAAKAGAEGLNAGRRGESYPIGEPDLVVELKGRIEAIDWDSHRKHALDGFWDRFEGFVSLEDAKEKREFEVDPSVEVADDVRDANGETLVKAGDRVNPLTMASLTKSIVVFRGTDVKQVEAAARIAHAARARGHGVILLTTEVERARGWAHLTELEEKLSGPVYLLTPQLAERFQLRRVPSLVVADGTQLKVTEIPIGVGR